MVLQRAGKDYYRGTAYGACWIIGPISNEAPGGLAIVQEGYGGRSFYVAVIGDLFLVFMVWGLGV